MATGELIRHKALKSRLRAVAGAEEREFERLYRESYAIVYNYISYRMAGADDVEDVVADAYLRAARAFKSFDPKRSKFSTWVISIGVNCMKDHHRKARPVANLDDVPESAFSVQGDQGEVDDRDQVQRLLAVLSEDERVLVFKKYYEGKRNVDIADEMDMNASTVSTKLANALSKMRAVAR